MSLEQIKIDLEKDITDNTAKIKAWEKVTYPTKKDGSAFKIMSKNFDGAEYRKMYHDSDSLCLQTSIECNTNNSQYWVYDNIHCGDKFKEDTLDEIKEKVLERIEYLQNNIDSLKHQLEIVENAYTEFERSYKDMCEHLKESVGTNNYGYINSIGRIIYQDIVSQYIH